MTIECQYRDGSWKRFTFKRKDLIRTSFRLDDDRPVKIKVPAGLSEMELKYITAYVDFRATIKIIQE